MATEDFTPKGRLSNEWTQSDAKIPSEDLGIIRYFWTSSDYVIQQKHYLMH